MAIRMWEHFCETTFSRRVAVVTIDTQAARRVKSARGRFFHYTVGIRAARFLDQRPRLFVADYLGNFAAFIEHLDFRATVSRTLPRIG